MGWTLLFPSVEKALFVEDLLDSPSLPNKVPFGSFVARILFADCLVRHGFGTERPVPCLDQTEAHAAFVPGITVESLQKLNMKMTKWNQNGRQVRLMTGGRALAMVHSKLLGKLVAGDERTWRG